MRGIQLDGAVPVALGPGNAGLFTQTGNTQFQRELAEAVSYLKGAIEHLGDVLETTGEQPELTPMPTPTPDSVVPDAPEWVSAPVPEPTVAQVEAAVPAIDLDDEPPLDEDYIEPDMDSAAYSYLDELASEHAAEPAP